MLDYKLTIGMINIYYTLLCYWSYAVNVKNVLLTSFLQHVDQIIFYVSVLTFISLAASSPAVASCFPSLSSSGAFKGS